jgi:ParG
MSKKEIRIPKRPGTAATPADAEAWINAPRGIEQAAKPEVPVAAEEPMKRLTIDIPERLHIRVKSQCAKRGAKMADEIRALLEQHFPEEG